MPNIKHKQPSSHQALRQQAGEMSSALSYVPVSDEELKEMRSYTEYLNEMYSPEAAVKRAERRRKLEEDADYEGQKESEFLHNISRYGASYGVAASNDYNKSQLKQLNQQEITDELLALLRERNDFMPDDVFERIINKQKEAKFEPVHKTADDFAFYKNGQKISNPFGAWIFNTIADLTYNNYKASKQKEEKQDTLREFYNYTEKAQKDAFKRYKNKLGITDKDVEQDGKKVITPQIKSEDERIYDALTSPMGRAMNINDRIEQIKYDPRRNPDTRFATSGYFQDATTQYAINLNEAQMRSFSGRIDRTAEVVARGKDAIQYYKNQEEIENIDNQLLDIQANGGDGNLYQQLLLRKLELQDDNKNLEQSKTAFEQYVPKDVDKILTGATKWLSDIENKVFGDKLYSWTTPIFDDADGLRMNLEGFNSAKSADLKEWYLNKYIKARDQKIKSWEKGIAVNEADKKSYEQGHNISDYFKYWEQHASGNIFSGDTWAYKQPGLMGYSNSSWIKQLPMYVGAMLAPWMGATGVTTTAAAGFAGAHSAAHDENYMELRENFIPVVERELKGAGKGVYETFISEGLNYIDKDTIKGKSDEEIDREVINAYLDGTYRPKTNTQAVYEATANATYGLNALFDRDMLAVDIDNIVNTAVLFGNFAQLGKLTKIVEPMANKVSPVVGYSEKLFKLTPAGKAVYKAIDDATTFMVSVPGKIYNEAKKIAPKAFKTPKTKNFVKRLENAVVLTDNPELKLAAKTSLNNLKKLAKATAASGIAEGIEEGKQYLAGQAFQRGELKDSSVTFGLGVDWGKWYDDMTNGIYSAYVIAGIPFNLESTHDPELVENIKGGIMGGLFQTGVTVSGQQALQTRNELKLNKYILNNVMAEKAARTDLFNKAKLYAAKSFSDSDVAYIRNKFDDLAKMNKQAKENGSEWALDDGIIEEQKRLFESVHSLAKSEQVKSRAKFLGFEPGDENYNNFIAQLALQQLLFNEVSTNAQSVRQQIRVTEELIEPIYSIHPTTGKIMRKNGDILLPYTGELLTYEDGTKETLEEAVDRLNSAHQQHAINAMRAVILQNLIAQLEVSDNGSTFGNSKSSREFLNRRLKKQLSNVLSYFNLPDRNQQHLQNLSESIPNKDRIEDLYRQLALLQVDQDYASMMYKSLMGQNAVHKTQMESEQSPNGVSLDYIYDDEYNELKTFDNIQKAFERRIEGDNALYDALERDYIERYEELERKREADARAIFLQQHPEFAETERVIAESQQKPQSYISATNKSTGSQVTYDDVAKLALKLKDKKDVKNGTIRNLFNKAGIKVDPKYASVVRDAVKQLVKGDITQHQFANLFVPSELRTKEAPSQNLEPEVKKEAPKTEEKKPTVEEKKVTAEEKPTKEVKAVPEAPKKPEIKPAPAKKPEEKPSTEPKEKKVSIVDSEDAARFEELKKQFKQITRGQLNSGGPIALMPIVTEMAFYVIKHGIREFVEYGKAILEQLGEDARPLLKSAYEGARYWPGAEEYVKDMTSPEVVASIDISTFDDDAASIQGMKEQFDVLYEMYKKLHARSLELMASGRNQELLQPLDELLNAITYLDEGEEFLTSQEYSDELNNATRLIANMKTLIQNAEKAELLTSPEAAQNKEINVKTDDPYELWAKTALESLSFYSTKIANNQQLSQEDQTNINNWIAIVKDQVNKLQTLATLQNLYADLLNQYESFVEMGITGNNSSALNVINIEETTTAPKWETLNTMHTASLSLSRATDDENIFLKQFTSDKDFLRDAEFEFVLGGSKTFEGGVAEGAPKKIYVIVTYKGHTFTPVAVWDTTSEDADEENKGFGKTVRDLIENNPGKKIVPLKVRRSKGRTFQQPNGQKVLLTEAGLVDDVYSISFDNEQEQFMLTRALPVANGKVLIRATKPNKSGTGVSATYTYSKESTVQTAGNVVYMMRIEGSDKPLLPINVFSDTMSEGDAQLIIDILSGKYTGGVIGKQAMDMPFIINGEYLASEDGGKTIGLTARDVLNLIMPYGPFGRKGSDIVHIWHSEFGDSRIIISGKFKNDAAFSNHEFNISTVQGKEAFKTFLMENVRKNISERVMKSSLGKPSQHKDNPLLGLANFVFSRQGTELRKRLQSGEEIRLGDSSIVFDWQDLSNEKRQGGITGLGWYVKRGFLKTDYAGINNAIINFTGAKVKSEDNTQKPKDEKPTATVAENGGTDQKPRIAEEKPVEVGKRRTIGKVRKSLEKRTSEISNENRNEQEIRSILAEIIPAGKDELTVTVSEGYLDDDQVSRLCAVSAAAPHVVGRCYADAIELYIHANLGVAYHEAFHRIAEIFLDDEERNKVYGRFERMYRLTHFGKKPSMEKMREGTADQFMMFMESYKSDLGLNSSNIFRRLVNTVKFIAKIGSYGQYKLYSQIAAGRFKNFKFDDAARKRAENFAADHPEGYGYTVDGRSLKYILNEHAFKDLVNSLVYFTFHANNISYDGTNINELSIDKDTIINSEMYKDYTSDNSLGSLALKEAMDNFDIFAPYIVSAISEFATDYRVVMEDENAEEAQSEDVSAASISEHTHLSYEFSQFSRATSKVRFFFSRIDDLTTKEVDGNVEYVDKLNGLGLPQFMPAKVIFNDVLNQLWDIEDLNDMMNRIAILSVDSPVYEQLYNRLNKIKDNAYKGKYNVDEEQLLVQIYNVIKSNKQQFLLSQSSKYYAGRDMVGYTISMQNTDQEYNARNYRFEWSNLFAHGGSIFVEVGENGKLVTKRGVSPKAMSQYWGLIVNQDPSEKLGIAAAFSSDDLIRKQFTMTLNVNGNRIQRQIDAKENKQDLDLCKVKFIQLLNCFGIQFDKSMLDYMLRQKYGNSGYEGMKQMFEETGVSSLSPVTFYMNGTYYEHDGKVELNISEDGRLNGRRPEEVFAYSLNQNESKSDSNGFFGELAKYKYLYRHSHDQLTVLAAAGNKFYVISENNYITDSVHFLNRAAKFYQDNDPRLSSEIEEFDELCNFAYNIIEDEDEYLEPIGSLILKQILKGEVNNLDVCTFSGMKSDYRGDKGVDYATISRRDDYVSKLAILFNGGLIFPTMSDKKTWTFIKGISLPGINWASSISGGDILGFMAHDLVSGENIVDNHGRIAPNSVFSYAVKNKNAVVDQLIEYFITEHAAIALTIADMKSLPEERKVANYHGGSKVKDKHGQTHVVIQGARHSSLLNLYADDGSIIPVSRVLDDNGEYIDEETLWNDIDEKFFALHEGETEEDLRNRQRMHVNRILRVRLEEELAKLEQMGLIRKVGAGNTIFDYENIGIDAAKVDQVYKTILSNYGVQEGTHIIRDTDGSAKEVSDLSEDDVRRFKSLALATVVNDGMVKSIISKNETERIFSGHPSFFKWGYDEQGRLVDRGVDQHKRYGGMVSTGQNAALWAKGVNAKYRSAEIDNEMVQSELLEFLQNTIYEGTLRNTLIHYLLDKESLSIDDDSASKITSEVDALSTDEVKDRLDKISKEAGSDILYLAEKQAQEKINDFKKDSKNKGIDVADGAAYVTDTFFEQMLRSIGAWNSTIERAFKILRGEEVDGKVYTIKDITKIAEATEAVHTAVIGTQKYTAYGQRMQNGWYSEDGQYHEGSTLIPYYDKFALFPLFKIICTGKMAHVYKAMQDQKVDMLKIKSAIKVGMEGSKPLNWSEWSDENGNITEAFHDPENGFKFNVYEQRMKYLRKQFNTDPKEKEFLTMGTQMTKVVMQALTPGRTYTTQDGRTMTAKQLRDDVMNCMNQIAKFGNKKFREEFFNNDGTVNLHAFAKMIKDELSRRGASRDVIDGFEVIKENGEDVFKISPSAQSDISWIQSILASVTNKRIVDINTPGNLFIQRSIWGMEGVTHLYGDEDIPNSINGGKKLQLINEEGSMDCVLSIDYFEHIIPKVPKRDEKGNLVYKLDKDENYIYRKDKDGNIITDKNGNPVPQIEMRDMSFNEAKQWLIDNGIISGIKTGDTKWSNATANIVGYRIPTQAISSIHAFRCVDVLPVVRDTVIMPSEITKVTGSDFDVDKMFLSMLNYKVSGKHAYDFDYTSDESEYYENRLIKNYISMLLNKDENGNVRNVQQLHGSIDKDTKLLTDTLDELESAGAFKERLTYQDYVLSNEVFIKQDFITGKNGIGPFALNNNNHILTMLYGVRFAKNKKSILTRLNLNRLDRAVDREGNSILSWLSGLINAHVDIAKDPYISRLGVNPFTYNMTNLLIRTGLGRYTFYFLTQPMIMSLAEVHSNATGVYGVDRTKTTSQIQKEARQKFIIDYINQNMGTSFSEYEYADAMSHWEAYMKNQNININQAIDYLFNQKTDILKNVSTQYKSTGNKLGANDSNGRDVTLDTKYGHVSLSMFDLQMLVYSAFEQFEPYAQALSSVVKYSKIDTKKQGKTITEQRAYRQGVHNTFISSRGLRKMFNGNLYRMYNESYIKLKTDLALDAFDDLLSSQLISATPQFERQLNIIFNVLNKSGERLTEELIKDITDAIVQQIKSRYINEYAKRNDIDIKSLVSGDNTIFDRLVKLLTDIKTKDEYSDLLVDGEINNYLLSSLVTALQQNIDQEVISDHNMQLDTYKNAKFVKLLNFLEDDQMDSDQLRSDWDQLLNDGTHPELQKFARDLVVYSFITTGDVGGGMRNLFKFVPNSWKLQRDGGNESYNDFMKRTLYEYNNNKALDIDIEDLILNNWKNYNFVPTYSIARKGGFRFQTYYPEGFDYPIILSGITSFENGQQIKPTFNEDPDSETYYPSPKYLKIERANEDIDEASQRKFNIYKRVAFGQYTDEIGETHVYPIYVLVGPKGNTFNGNYKILEYGRSDQTYNEVATAVAKDPLIRILLKYTNQLYTNVESLVSLIANALPASEQILQLYNKAVGTNIQMNDVLRFIASGYAERENMINDGGTVLHAKYSRSIVESDPQNMYIFTDNTDRTSGTSPIDENSWYAKEYGNGKLLKYPSVTTAQIRGLENAFPISNQKYYNDEKKGVSGRWEDSDYDMLVNTVEKELARILAAWFSGIYKNIILPAGAAFVDSNIAAITKERTPKLYEYFSKIEDRIRNMVENNVPLIKEEDSVFLKGDSLKESMQSNLGTSLKALEFMALNGNKLAEKLVFYAKNNDVDIIYARAKDEYKAKYNILSNKIYVNIDSDAVVQNLNEVLLHEIIHSLTSKWLKDDKHKAYADNIKVLMNYAKQSLSKEALEKLEGIHPNMFKNEREFLTYATSNKMFRDELKAVKPMDENTFVSLFEELIATIKDIIHKIIGTEDSSILQQIDPIVDRVLDLQYNLFDNYQYNSQNDSEKAQDEYMEKLNVHGHAFGWSIESIKKHLIGYVEESTGYTEKHRRARVKEINSIYGTNFGVYKDKATGNLKLKNNTIPVENLNLSDNPNEPKQLELFDNAEIKSQLKELGSQTLKDCGY